MACLEVGKVEGPTKSLAIQVKDTVTWIMKVSRREWRGDSALRDIREGARWDSKNHLWKTGKRKSSRWHPKSLALLHLCHDGSFFLFYE